MAPLKSKATLDTDPHDKAEILLNEFSSVFTIEDVTSIPWLGPAINKIGDMHCHRRGSLKTSRECQTTSGPDRIANLVLRELHAELTLTPVMTALFNQSLSSGSIPKDWSNALITPVYTKGNIHVTANYRPVSLTCVACKLLEHIVCSHIMSFLQKHELLTPLQHGFRKAHSCETQLLITVEDFFSAYDKNIQTDVGVLDFS